MLRFIGMLCILLLIAEYIHAQAEKSYFVSAGFGVGRPVNNFVGFPEITSPAQIVDIHLGRNLNGYKEWHQSYNMPHQGIGIMYASLGNAEVLGNMYGLSYEFDADMILSEASLLRLGVGVGAAYLDKSFSETSNPGNIVNGSRYTGLVKASLIYEYRISTMYSAFAGLAFFHTSNSHTQLPNVGMNLPYLNAGLQYSESFKSGNVIKRQRELRRKGWHPGVRAAFAFNEHGGTLGATGGPKYPIYLISFYASNNYRYTRKWTAGIDIWYNRGVKSFILSQDYYDSNIDLRSSVLSLNAGHEFLMGRFSFVMHGGIYLYNPFYRKRWRESNERNFHQYLKTLFPGRVGMLYYFGNPITAGSGMFYSGAFIKTNLGQADFLETTLGFQF